MGEALDALVETIAARRTAAPDQSYTAKLLASGVKRCAQKLGEEAVETAIAAAVGNRTGVVGEAADLLFHLSVLLAAADVDPREVAAELARRRGVSGLEEKALR
ncbi:MAG: phosphoribosyl-ATP diphosphatase [Pseudomonadota bacterium]